MRLFENGPDIPLDLFEQQRLKNVVFFCGAGISMKAGLPNFKDLTNNLVKRLCSHKAQAALNDKQSFDQIFRILIEEFGCWEIDDYIFNSLNTPANQYLENHCIIFELSKNIRGEPRIITTNFDLLFEKVEGINFFYEPHSLPNLSFHDSLKGVVYLHGRLKEVDALQLNSSSRSNYIISSSDFGWAYLADGWATNFVKSLREHYTIVFLGYSADDPPMRYLLEGLHSLENTNKNYSIYAFTPHDSDLERSWKSRGVTPIAYEPLDNNHSGLWKSLSRWSKISKKTDIWNRYIKKIVKIAPYKLKPHQRRQVADFIINNKGAKFFSYLNPSPHPAWICVFDSQIRCYDEDIIINKKRYNISENLSFDKEDFKAKNYIEDLIIQLKAIANYEKMPSIGDSANLDHLDILSSWITQSAHTPIIVWWAAGCKSLSSNLFLRINTLLLDENSFPKKAREFWQLYVEQLKKTNISYSDFDLLLKKNGWNEFVIRQFEYLVEPRLNFERLFTLKNIPDNWDNINLTDIIKISVYTEISRAYKINLKIPDEILPIIIEIIRKSLSKIFKKNDVFFGIPSFCSKIENFSFHGIHEKYCDWFFVLFKQLKSYNCNLAKEELYSWDFNDSKFFGPSSILAYRDKSLFTHKEVFDFLLKINFDIFKYPHNQESLILLLKSRWNEFSLYQKKRLENKILNFLPIEGNSDQKKIIRNNNKLFAANILSWLSENGCELTENTAKKLSKIKIIFYKNKICWGKNFFVKRRDQKPIFRNIEKNDLDQLSYSKIIARAKELTQYNMANFIENRPFIGLVSCNPIKAFIALLLDFKRGSFPINFWSDLLEVHHEKIQKNYFKLILSNILKFPEKEWNNIKFDLLSWLSDKIELFVDERNLLLRLYVRIKRSYSPVEEENCPELKLSDNYNSDVSFEISRKSSVGILTKNIWDLINKGNGNRKKLLNIMKCLFNLPGIYGGYAVCVTSHIMNKLYPANAGWIDQYFIPFFSIESNKAEAAWHGLIDKKNVQFLQTITQGKLLSTLLFIVANKASWRLTGKSFENLVSILITDSVKSNSCIPPCEVKKIIIRMSDKQRYKTLEMLEKFLSENDGWPKIIKPFMTELWPRQLALKTKMTSYKLLDILEGHKNDFCDKVSVILPFLVSISVFDIPYISCFLIDDQKIPQTYPRQVLSLLNILVDKNAVIDGRIKRILDIVIESDPSISQTDAWIRLKRL